MKNKITLALTGAAIAGALLVSGTAFAQSNSTTAPQGQSGHMMAGMRGGMPPGVFGTVSAINGDTLTVTQKAFARPGSTATSGTSAAPVTYTVNATGATVTKNNAASSLSSVAVGDMVMVQGTVSGTSVTATAIHDGLVPQGGMQGKAGQGWGGHASSTPSTLPQGNGQPVVGGTVTAVSGSTVTITNKSNVTYTIDASSATVNKANATSSLSQVAVGDNVIVQGAVNGNNVTASSIIDQGAPKTATSGSSAGGHGMIGGILGGIGGFLQHVFGFF